MYGAGHHPTLITSRLTILKAEASLLGLHLGVFLADLPMEDAGEAEDKSRDGYDGREHVSVPRSGQHHGVLKEH